MDAGSPVPVNSGNAASFDAGADNVFARIAARYDLLRGIHGFPDQQTFVDELHSHGFEQASFTSFSLGIVALHRAVKPR